MREKQSHSEQSPEKLNDIFQLILINDDHNRFDHVIKSLIEVCGHDAVQAEQCAVITHFTGQCDIRRGEMAELQRMYYGLQERNLNVEITK
jgi:ATP-dependent Clp protease adaptor protein ClpS